jgi:hypothetical protein
MLPLSEFLKLPHYSSSNPARAGSSLYSFQLRSLDATQPPSHVCKRQPWCRLPWMMDHLRAHIQERLTKFVQERTKARNLRRKKRKQIKAIRQASKRSRDTYERRMLKVWPLPSGSLGLLRAETEKVTLFAQARLGEFSRHCWESAFLVPMTRSMAPRPGHRPP